MDETTSQRVVEEACESIDAFSWLVGGLVLYGCTPEWIELRQGITEFIATCANTPREDPEGSQRLACFVPAGHGKTTIARLVKREIHSHRDVHLVVDGLTGSWQTLRQAAEQPGSCFIVDGLPSDTASRSTTFGRLGQIKGDLLLLADPIHELDKGTEGLEHLSLRHVDLRPADKACWLLGLIWEEARAREAQGGQEADSIVRRLPKPCMIALCDSYALEQRISNLTGFARSLVDRIVVDGLGSPQAELDAGAFLEVSLPLLRESETGRGPDRYHVWTEGETDVTILSLASRLAAGRLNGGLLEGLEIVATGMGREGGTTNMISVVMERRTHKSRDLFLLDNDPPGRRAKEILKDLDQRTMLLPEVFCRKQGACADMVEVEIEDLISLSCIDRFFEARRDLTPEYEGLHYGSPEKRHLVVRGADKGALVDWLCDNASYEDLERVTFVLCEIRQNLGLPIPIPRNETRAWRDRLCGDAHPSSGAGLRPLPWWYVAASAE